MFNILNHRISDVHTTQDATQGGTLLGSNAQSLEHTPTRGEGRGQMRFPIPYLTPLPVRNPKGDPFHLSTDWRKVLYGPARRGKGSVIVKKPEKITCIKCGSTNLLLSDTKYWCQDCHWVDWIVQNHKGDSR